MRVEALDVGNRDGRKLYEIDVEETEFVSCDHLDVLHSFCETVGHVFGLGRGLPTTLHRVTQLCEEGSQFSSPRQTGKVDGRDITIMVEHSCLRLTCSRYGKSYFVGGDALTCACVFLVTEWRGNLR